MSSSFRPSTQSPQYEGSSRPNKRVRTSQHHQNEGDDVVDTDNDDNNSDQEGPSTPGATIEIASEAATKLEKLTLVTYNIVACQPSAMASHLWSKDDSLQAIREEVVKEQPDIIALQEFPEFALFRTSRLFPDHDLLGYHTSHAPYVTLFVRKGIQAKLVPVHDDSNGVHLPAVVAELSYPPLEEGGSYNEYKEENRRSRRRLWIASVHLEPFANGADCRHLQVQSLIQSANRFKVPLIVAGDLNMRVAEDATMEGVGYDLLDFWKLAGSNFTTKYTWNTRNEIKNGGYFNQFYGTTTREYISRYDRIYFHRTVAKTNNNGQASEDSKKSAIDENFPPITVKSFKLMANRPVGSSKHHFLSDHFGISSTFTLKWAPD
jgi:endonuclease/exonuclease/phosphatase family metal-dependent hydrolase